MAFKQQPLKQEDYNMKIIKDLGKTTANKNTTNFARYAIFECNSCKKHFKARCGGSAAKKQSTCYECTRNYKETTKHPLYAIWNGIKQRCYSKKRKDYHKYGGIGVTMADYWINDAQGFIDWCLENGWNKDLVVDKDIKSRILNIDPPIYSKDTISFISVQKNAEEANAKTVLQFDLDGNLLNEFVSTVEAAKAVGTGKSSIANACRGTTKTSMGFKWKYK
jgi:hypothetical protein